MALQQAANVIEVEEVQPAGSRREQSFFGPAVQGPAEPFRQRDAESLLLPIDDFIGDYALTASLRTYLVMFPRIFARIGRLSA